LFLTTHGCFRWILWEPLNSPSAAVFSRHLWILSLLTRMRSLSSHSTYGFSVSLDSLGTSGFTRRLWILSLLIQICLLLSRSISGFSQQHWILSVALDSLSTSGFSRPSGLSWHLWIFLASGGSLGISGFSVFCVISMLSPDALAGCSQHL
jgi:hypothetical protein